MFAQLMAVAGLVGFGGMVLLGPSPVSGPLQEAAVPVEVNVTCTGTRVEFSIDPWIVRLNQGDQVEWILNTNADAEEIEITPKRGRWPFAQQSHRGNKQDRARAANMRANQQGQRFQYNITLTCQPEGQDPYEVVIDPDIIIN